MVNFDQLYSDRAGKMRKSEIRELLKVTQDPEIISFAGGLPSPQSFPIQDLKGIVQTVLDHYGKVALQYGTTQGINELREVISERSIREGMKGGVTPENIMITSGSQQALDAVGKIFLNPGDIAMVGLPSYLGGINAFRSYEANLVGIPLDKEGMRVDLLEEKIKELIKQDMSVKFIYTIPTFQNPAGTVMPESRRKKLVEIAHEYNLVIIEDDPYGKLRYDIPAVKPIKAFDDEGRVIYMSTFSKILAPGFRLAWIIAAEDIMRKLAVFLKSRHGLDRVPVKIKSMHEQHKFFI